IPPPGLPINPHAVTQTETPDDLWSYENVVRGLDEVSFRVTQEAKAFARDLDDAVAEFRFPFDLAVLRRAALAADRFIALIPFIDARCAAALVRFNPLAGSIEVAPLFLGRSIARAIMSSGKSP